MHVGIPFVQNCIFCFLLVIIWICRWVRNSFFVVEIVQNSIIIIALR